MKFTNRSAKIIGINGVYLMPDESIEITKKQSESPAVQAYLRLNLGTLEEGQIEFQAAVEAAAKAAAEKAAEEATAKAAAEKELAANASESADTKAEEDAPAEQKPATKRGRSSKNAATETKE